jgi:anti-sigma regulatory factor (Ser/Thr protein kinase)
MEVSTPLHLRLDDASAVGDARRRTAALGRAVGLSDPDVARLGLVVTEAGTNAIKHAGGGELLAGPLPLDVPPGVALVALDRGPGIRDLGSALRDGYSSAGTLGQGLGAIERLSSAFDVFAPDGGGAALYSAICSGDRAQPPAGALLVGGVNVPHRGETVSGDAWAMRRSGPRTLVLVADGLGHGTPANEAARAAVDSFLSAREAASPADCVERIHGALRATRGAAVAVAEVDLGTRMLRFSGLGNLGATILDKGASRSLASHHGTAGHDARRIQEFAYPWPRGALLFLHTEGLGSRWTLEKLPGLGRRHPTLVAGVLYREFGRGRDDTTVVVVREVA